MKLKITTKISTSMFLFGISVVQAAETPVKLDPNKYHVRLSTRNYSSPLIETSKTNMASQAPSDWNFRSEIGNVYIRNKKTGDCFTPEMVLFLQQFSGLSYLTVRCSEADKISFPSVTHREGWKRNLKTLTIITEASNLNEALADLPENMPGLKKVNIYSDRPTEEGIKNIAKLPFLDEFCLHNKRVAIDDIALTPLATHPALRKVHYGSTTKKGEEPALRALYESRQKTTLPPFRYINGRSCEAYNFSSPLKEGFSKRFFGQEEIE